MTSRDFAYWLMGVFEVGNPKELDATQTRIIKQHLALVFKHEIDPSYSDDPKVQAEMNAIHNGHQPSTPGPGGVDEDGNVYRC